MNAPNAEALRARIARIADKIIEHAEQQPARTEYVRHALSEYAIEAAHELRFIARAAYAKARKVAP